MKPIIKITVGLLLLTLLQSCFPTKISFDPYACWELDNKKEIIQKIYLSQLEGHVPLIVNVTDEYVTWSNKAIHNRETGEDVIIMTNKNTIYFSRITKLTVVKDFSRYEIRIVNGADGVTHIVFLNSLKLAIEGYSAIACMMKGDQSEVKKTHGTQTPLEISEKKENARLNEYNGIKLGDSVIFVIDGQECEGKLIEIINDRAIIKYENNNSERTIIRPLNEIRKY